MKLLSNSSSLLARSIRRAPLGDTADCRSALLLAPSGDQRGSAFIIILWIAFGLVSLALYFGHSMISELRASENRVAGISADQAIEGAERYVTSFLANQIASGSNGFMPDPHGYLNEAVPVGDAHFWLIGRDTNYVTSGPGIMSFGLVDEASKINLNSASSNILDGLAEQLPRVNLDIVSAILDWRDTNGLGQFQTYYASRPQPYQTKAGPFESVNELRLVYGGDMESLVGDDINENGILDPNENDESHNGQVDPGLLEYVTVFSREPNTQTNGQPRINIRTVTGSSGPLQTLLQQTVGSSRADQIMSNLGLQNAGAARRGNVGQAIVPTATFQSLLQFYRLSKMTADEFAGIANSLTVTNGSYIVGRININTASDKVLGALPGLNTNPDLAQTVIAYRQGNPDKLTSIAWIVDALGQNNSSVLDVLQTSDCLTTSSYQVTADVAALGPNHRGYRRTRFVFDTSDGTPKVVYRQDLTHLGWALGKDARQVWLAAATP
jgi:type II secretory pathway component PulK